MRTRAIAFLLLVPHLGACSFAFVRGPPAGHEGMAAFACTTSSTAPVLDLVWLSYMTLASVAENGSWGAADIAVGGAYAGSAFYGFKTSARCRAAISEANLRPAATRARLEPQRQVSQPTGTGPAVAHVGQGLVLSRGPWKRVSPWLQGAAERSDAKVVGPGHVGGNE